MSTKSFELDKPSLDQIVQIEQSIKYWSFEYTKLSLQSKSMLESIESMHQARQQIMDRAYQSAGINPSDIIQSKVSSNGKVDVHIKDTNPSEELQSESLDSATLV